MASLADAGVWDVENVLEATFARGDFEPHTLSIEVEDVPGVLNQASLPYSNSHLQQALQIATPLSAVLYLKPAHSFARVRTAPWGGCTVL